MSPGVRVAGKPIRLQVHLARCGVASRRSAEALIGAGRVSVNGQVVRGQGVKIRPGTDRVEVNGRPLGPSEETKRYFVFHKPRGVVTTVKDPHAARTVHDYFRDVPERLFPAGRLDKESTGLILMTNDGDLVHRLTHPRYGAEKRYCVRVKGKAAPEVLRRLERGVMLHGRRTAPCRIKILGSGADASELEVSLREGRKREIRELMNWAGLSVTELQRTAYGPLTLGGLREGLRRELEAEEWEPLVLSIRGRAGATPHGGRRG